MPFHTADILIHGVRSGDATSHLIFDLARTLGAEGVRLQILCDQYIGALPGDVEPLVRHTDYAAYTPTAELTILQYPVWFALAERFRQATGAMLFWYHGITPPALWQGGADREILQIAQARSELVWHAHLAVATSPFTAQELHQHSGYPMERIRVIPLTVPVETFRQRPPAAQLAQVRAQWRLNGKRVLLYVGRIASNKRIDLLVTALAELKPTFPDLHLLVVGDTNNSAVARDLSARLRDQATSLGLTDNVTFTGRVEVVEPYYQLAEVVVQASQHEGFGAPLLEGMAAGVPVVASASGAMPWVLEGERGEVGAAGLLFQPGAASDLARQVARILTEPALRQSLVERGARRVAEFTVERFQQRVRSLLVELAELAQAPPPIAMRPHNPLYEFADVALRGYRVRSHIPILGRLVEWVRTNSTTHLKEAYLDRIIEQQVNYNRLLADEIERLRTEVEVLRTELAELRKQQE